METVASCNICQSSALLSVDAAWNLCRCEECGFVFDNPRPTLDEIIAFYSQAEKYNSWLSEEAARELLWKRRLRLFLRYRSPGNLLDIGTGIGQFLHVARPYFTAVHGTEVSESGVRVAREKYRLDVLRGVVEDLDLPDGAFDNITLYHVLEHVPDPARLVRTCWRLLSNGGTLAVAVPNDVLAWASWIKKFGKLLHFPAFSKFSPVLGISKAGSSREIHLSHFTPPVLRRLLENQGFSIVFDSLDPYYSAAGISLLAHSILYSFHLGYSKVSGGNRYQTIMMIARKQSANPPMKS